MNKTKIARINALAKKAKTVGLNERETAERDALRKEYLAEMRASFKAQLDSTYVQTADGACRAGERKHPEKLRQPCTIAPKITMEICKAVCYNKRTAADPGCSRRRLKCLMAIPRYCLDYEFLRKR